MFKLDQNIVVVLILKNVFIKVHSSFYVFMEVVLCLVFSKMQWILSCVGSK